MKYILILFILFNLVYSEVIEDKRNNIVLEFKDKLHEKRNQKLWENLTIINKNTNKKIIISSNNKSEPLFSDELKFSPDGQFLMYKTYLSLDTVAEIKKIEYQYINCVVIDLYEDRNFDEPALSRCRSEWYEKEPHTLVNAENVGYDDKGDAYLQYFYRLPKESFNYDYKIIEREASSRQYKYLKDRFTVPIIKKYTSQHIITKNNATKYNNIAYYLEQAGAYKEAIYLLEKIIEKFPNRTVAYINLGDAYWNDNNKEKAKKAYQTYIHQMKEQGKENRIPKKVLERVTK